jgi:hypothetical protein
VKQLFRIIGKGGRVKYVVIYVDGEVREVRCRVSVFDLIVGGVVTEEKYKEINSNQ